MLSVSWKKIHIVYCIENYEVFCTKAEYNQNDRVVANEKKNSLEKGKLCKQ